MVSVLQTFRPYSLDQIRLMAVVGYFFDSGNNDQVLAKLGF